MLYLDLETRSQVDLITKGLLNYARNTTTQTICMSYAFGAGPVQTWFAGEPFPADVLAYIAAGGLITAHNASFERHLFDFVLSADYDFNPPRLDQWRCSSAIALAHGLPGALGQACQALGLPIQKQKHGSRLIRIYSAPGHLREFLPGDRELMKTYCEHDVLAMRQLVSVLRDLTPDEWAQYRTTERINDRGVPVDTVFSSCALEYAETTRAEVAAKIKALTYGRVARATQRKTRDAWLVDHLPGSALDCILTAPSEDSPKKIKFDKAHRAKLAAHPDTPPNVREFVELVEQAGGATISKYKTINETHVDGRIHGALTWNGAGQTGRYASRGLQLQNMRRDAYADPQQYINKIIAGEPLETPTETLGRLVRAAIHDPAGLAYSDYAQIEARVLPWLANDTDAEKTLDIFREDRDLYTENARAMFNCVEVDKATRQAAKVAVLACGFGGGKGAIQAMASAYGLKYSADQAQNIVGLWRESNPWAPKFWGALSRAANDAVRQPGIECTAGRVSFMCSDNYILWMKLPSGRCLAYFFPRFELVLMPWGDEEWALTVLWGGSRPKIGQPWPRRALSHLVLAENATQGTAADIMRETITRAEAAGLPVLFSVHDELVVSGTDHASKLDQIMHTPPLWAGGLPIAAETVTAERYGK